MALSLESTNNVWAKVNTSLDSLGANSAIRDQFRALKAYLSQIKGNPNLQFVPISNLTAETVIADAACTLYAAFVKKQNTSTAAFFKINDSATTAGAANGAGQVTCVELNAANQQGALLYPAGAPQGTGIAVVSQTNAAGDTDSTSGDGPNGFIVLGA